MVVGRNVQPQRAVALQSYLSAASYATQEKNSCVTKKQLATFETHDFVACVRAQAHKPSLEVSVATVSTSFGFSIYYSGVGGCFGLRSL